MNHHEFLINSASERLLNALDARDDRDKAYRAEPNPQISHLLRQQSAFWNRKAANASQDLERYLDDSESRVAELKQAIVEAEEGGDYELAQGLQETLAELERELDPAEL